MNVILRKDYVQKDFPHQPFAASGAYSWLKGQQKTMEKARGGEMFLLQLMGSNCINLGVDIFEGW